MDIQGVLARQRAFYRGHSTLGLDYRKRQLRKLKSLIQNNETLLYEAIYQDFGKSKFDTFTTELAIIIQDIDYYLRHMARLARPKSVRTNLACQIASSKIYREPLGCTLVIGAWNYPYQLTLLPMVAAIAAGNTCIVKPSEVAANAMKAVASIINANFDDEFLFVAQGGADVAAELLKLRFDKIFFTGSPRVGRLVYEAAAKHLTPVTLELGGKSPVIVTDSAELDVAARRIVWGKFINAGQTCIAPDYVLVDETVEADFVAHLKYHIDQFSYGPDASHYTKIINDRHFERLVSLIDPTKVYHGGTHDANSRYIAPTVLREVEWNDPVMQEEIFGPILPVLTYRTFYEAIGDVWDYEKPLAAYLFTTDVEEKDLFASLVPFGGGCINDVIMHAANPRLPFGGVGNSGMGSYHGKFGFDAFSHRKPIMDRATWGEPNLRYPPYTESKYAWIRRII